MGIVSPNANLTHSGPTAVLVAVLRGTPLRCLNYFYQIYAYGQHFGFWRWEVAVLVIVYTIYLFSQNLRAVKTVLCPTERVLSEVVQDCISQVRKLASPTFLSDDCMYCFDAPPTVRFDNCGHVSACYECVELMKSIIQVKCPLCRSGVSQFSVSYLTPAKYFHSSVKKSTEREVNALVRYINRNPAAASKLSPAAQREVRRHTQTKLDNRHELSPWMFR